MAPARFAVGDRVRVMVDVPPGHHRTPGYIKGKTGRIESVHGEFRNPESLAYGGEGLPKQPLYLVSFRQDQVWEDYEAPSADRLVIDIYEHWLEPV